MLYVEVLLAGLSWDRWNGLGGKISGGLRRWTGSLFRESAAKMGRLWRIVYCGGLLR